MTRHWHTADVFRSMLLALAGHDPARPGESLPPDLATLGPLADWLEEQGDGRAAEVRRLSRLTVFEYTDGGISYWYIAVHKYAGMLEDRCHEPYLTPDRAAADIARRVLALFPEAPRWYVGTPKPGTTTGPIRAMPYPTKWDAKADTGPIETIDGRATVFYVHGPFWPDPPKSNQEIADEVADLIDRFYVSPS